jgi:DNA helicase-2/ATP-dependent DNA helicase PcrA
VFHVAITRGSSSVTIVAGSEPSPFIDELTEEWRPAATPTRPERRSRPAPDPSPPLDVQAKGSGSERAREALRSWRSQRAKSEGKPAFIYFNDETLDAMAAAMPATTAALARIRGIGPAKLDAYGDELLSLLDSIRAPDGGTEAPERGRPYT